MTTPRDPDSLLAAYLADGIDVLPDRVADAVLVEAHRTRQRVVFGPRRTPVMNSTFKVILAAAAVIAVVVAGISLLPRNDAAVGGPSSASPSAGPLTSPSASGPPAVSEFPGVSDDVAPGTYLWSAGAATPADITFTVPAGWASRFGIPNKDRGGPGEIAVGNWIIENVYTDPCQWQGSLLDPPVGPTVDDLATALAVQKDRDATAPSDVMLGGYPAKRIELSIPADLDPATCDEGVIRTWVSPGEDASIVDQTETLGVPPGGMHPGQLNVVYIVDVEGDRLVIDTWHMPGTSAADLAELDGILASMRIAP